MPNWCNNYLELTHEDPAMIERAKKAFADGRLLDEFVPVPKDLHIVAGRVGADDNAEQIKLEEDTKRNLEVHGYANWYDFAVNEWGTKWDVGGDDGMLTEDGPNALRMSFDSAWAPPVPAMEKFMDLGFTVKLIYWESGMCFCGLFDENGDDYYDYTDMSADEIAETINSEIDECMCITESIREWEEDNREDEDETPHEFGTPGSFTVEEGLKKEDK
jgi:hypothetical protein